MSGTWWLAIGAVSLTGAWLMKRWERADDRREAARIRALFEDPEE